jgi:hypothetical protein
MAKQIASQDLYAFLCAEFEKARPEDCKTCVVPKPFWGPSAGPGSGYWYMEPAFKCPQGCRQVIAEIWAKTTTDFEILPPSRDAMSAGAN